MYLSLKIMVIHENLLETDDNIGSPSANGMVLSGNKSLPIMSCVDSPGHNELSMLHLFTLT